MEPIPERIVANFWRKVQKSEGCWSWTAHKHVRGYGQFWDGRKLVQAPRFSYELHFREIPEGMCVCHRCDNPNCVRPDHLFLGTRSDNNLDAVAKGRMTGCHRLSMGQAYEVRELYATGRYSRRKLGRMFGLTHPHIGRIINNLTY